MRHSTPVWQGDFIAKFGVPSNAGTMMATRPTVALFKYQDVMNVLKDATSYTNGFIAEGLGAVFDGLIILAMDGLQHKNVRALLQPAFMPETVNKWKPAIDKALREEYILPMVASKQADLMQFGLNFPIRVIYAVMGFPEDPHMYRQYATWGLAILGANILDPEKLPEARPQAGLALKALYDSMLAAVVARRAAGATGDDLASRLIRAHQGTFVQCMVASANRDETVFEDSDIFNIDRRQKPSFGFGFGPHMCIGQFVAKVEIVSAINAVLDLLPNVRLDPAKPAPQITGAHLRGASQIHVIWD